MASLLRVLARKRRKITKREGGSRTKKSPGPASAARKLGGFVPQPNSDRSKAARAEASKRPGR